MVRKLNAQESQVEVYTKLISNFNIIMQILEQALKRKQYKKKAAFKGIKKTIK